MKMKKYKYYLDKLLIIIIKVKYLFYERKKKLYSIQL